MSYVLLKIMLNSLSKCQVKDGWYSFLGIFDKTACQSFQIWSLSAISFYRYVSLCKPPIPSRYLSI